MKRNKVSSFKNAAFQLLSPHLINDKLKNKTAYIDDFGSHSYLELFNMTTQVAVCLQKINAKPNQRILVCMLDTFTLPSVFLGAIRAGAIPILTSTMLTEKDYAYMIDDSEAKIAIVSDEFLPMFKKIKKNRKNFEIILSESEVTREKNCESFLDYISKPTDPCFWLYSSGSTGNPKGTIHKHESLYLTYELYAKSVLKISESDTIFSAAKIFFAYGLGNALSFPICAGSTVILKAQRPTPESVFDVLTTKEPTIFFGVPTLFAALLASNQFPDKKQLNLRLAVSAGEPLPPEIGKKWLEKTGVELLDGIGSTEMLHIFLSNKQGESRLGTTGTPVNGYKLKIMNDDNKECLKSEIGELYVEGATCSIGYWKKEEKSKTTFIDGWTKTGDKFIRDHDGYYIYQGRSDDMLKVGGIYVSPTEVENCLCEHPAVLESAVIGTPDERQLIKPKAFVVLNHNYSQSESLKDELKLHVKSNLAIFKYPRWITFIEELPKTATGKIMRYKLRNY